MTDDPPPHVIEMRRKRAEAEGRLTALLARVTTHVNPKTSIVSGVALALFVRDDPAGGYTPQHDDEHYPDPTAAELLDILGYVPDVRNSMDDDERRLIEGARRRGATWQEIAEALGLKSRQAARQRYARRGGKPTELDKQIEEQESPHGN